MAKVNVFEIKAKLSEYLDRAARGERIIVCRHNRPVAELRGIQPARTAPRPIGRLPGRPEFDVPAAFFEPLSEEELAAWDGAAALDSLASISPKAGATRSSRVAAAASSGTRAERKRTARRAPRRRS